MFSKEDLDTLIGLQSDDWNPRYFRTLVQKHGTPSLIQYLNQLDYEQIRDLQLALDLLSGLPSIQSEEAIATPVQE